MRKFLSLLTILFFTIQLKAQIPCATYTEGCTPNGAYQWVFVLEPGASISFDALAPPSAWTVTQTGTNPEEWTVVATDPDPSDFLNFSIGTIVIDGPACDAVPTLTVGLDCILDGCPNCGSAVCDIIASTPLNIQCNDNGTPSDATDDTYTFEVTVSEVSGGTSWTANDPLSSTGSYGATVTMGPYNISDGGFTITFTDASDPSCTTDIGVTPPAPCSTPLACSITSSPVADIQCNDNGTPNDTTDDTFTFTVTISETNGGASWTANDPLSSTGTYGTAITLGPYNISDGAFMVVFSDIDDPSCTTNVSVLAPQPCSVPQPCSISTTTPANIDCNDNGTPNDTTDDTFTFTITVTDANGGSGWIANDPLNSSGNYGITTTMGPYPVSAGNVNFTITDNSDPTCVTSASVTAPAPCSVSTTCSLFITQASAGACNANGTPFDPSDDTFPVTVDASATNGGTEYIVSDGQNTYGPFPYNLPVLIELPADGNNYTLTYTDTSDPTCTNTATVSQSPCCIIDVTSTIVPVTTDLEGGEIHLCFNSGMEPFNIVTSPITNASVYPVPGDCTYNYIISGLPTGSYAVNIMDAMGCVAVLDNQVVTQESCTDFQISDATSMGISCVGESDGQIEINLYTAGNANTITVDVGNGIPPMTFSGTLEGSPLVFDGLPPGEYDLTLFDNNGCQATYLFNPVTVAGTTPISPDNTVTDATTIGGTDGSIELCLSGSAGGFMATIDPPVGTIASNGGCQNGGESILISDLPAGEYTVSIEDANGCSLELDFIVNDPSCPLTLEVTDTESIICGGASTGSISFEVTGGTSPYSVSLDGGQTFQPSQATSIFDVVDLPAGDYPIIVMDDGGCSVAFDNPITLTENTPITLSADVTHVSAFQGTDGSAVLCINGGNLPYTVSVLPNTGTLIEGVSTNECMGFYNLSQLEGGVYQVTIVDDLDCTQTFDVEILAPECDDFMIQDTILTHVTCFGGNDGAIEIMVQNTSAALPFTYELSGVQSIETNDLSVTFDGLEPGEYTLTVMDANGCMFPFAEEIEITEPQRLSTNLTEISPCAGDDNGILCLDPIGGMPAYTYNVFNTDDEGNLLPVEVGPSADCNSAFYIDEMVSAGTYLIELVDMHGCKAQAIYTVSEITVSVSLIEVIPDCEGASLGGMEVQGTGGTMPYTYDWNQGSDQSILTGVESGTYTVIVTDARGCTGEFSESIGESNLTLGFQIEETCAEQNAGGILAQVGNGTPIYDLEWTSGAANGIEENIATDVIAVSDLGVGIYDITVTDDRGCTVTGSTEVTPYVMMADMVVDSACVGQSNGFVGATAINGIPDFTFNWSNGAVDGIVTGLDPGTYTVTITDLNGCTATGETEVTEYDLSADFQVGNVCSGDDTGIIVLDVINGTAPMNYQWSSGDGGSTITDIGAGEYTVTVLDDKGCTLIASTTVSEFESPVATASDDTAIEAGESTEISVTVLGGSEPYSYNWIPATSSPNSSSTQVTPPVTTTYTVEVTDANGCMTSDTVNVLVVEAVTVSMPTAFSPNDDTKNDVYEPFVPFNAADIQVFQVFDRWGQLLHNDPTAPWDGKFKGKDQPVGTYVYLVEYLDLLDRKSTLKGHFNLIR